MPGVAADEPDIDINSLADYELCFAVENHLLFDMAVGKVSSAVAGLARAKCLPAEVAGAAGASMTIDDKEERKY